MTEAALPDDWELVRLGDHFTITSSKRVFQRDWRSSGVPFYRARELAVLGGKGRVENELFIDREIFDRYRRAFGAPSPGDFLVTGVGTLGKTYVVRAGDEFYFKDGNIIWFKASTTVDSSYLNQLYRTPIVLDQVFGNSGGSTVGTYTITNAKLTVVPLPPQKEQAAIAATLADADDLIATLERLIAKKQAIKQGMMQQLLTGRTRLPGFINQWVDTRLGEALAFQVGFPFRSEYFSNTAPGVRLIRNRDLKSDDSTVYYRGPFSQSYVVESGDILVGMDGTFTPCRWSSGRAILNQRVGRIRPLRCVSDFIYFALHKPLGDIEAGTGATTVKHLSHKDIESLVIPLPGAEEQTAIAEVLLDVEREIEALCARLTKAQDVKTGMMQQLLTGRTRLPVEVES